MAKNQNIVHLYYRKKHGGLLILVKINPIHYTGTEITIAEGQAPAIREMQFDAEIFEDLKADIFQECSPMEFNLYLSGLA